MRLYTLGDRFNLCGERVREARMRMGWSQEELAAKLQPVSYTHLTLPTTPYV